MSYTFPLNNPKNLDPSHKMDLDIWDCFGRKKQKPLSYNRRNTVLIKLNSLISRTITVIISGVPYFRFLSVTTKIFSVFS